MQLFVIAWILTSLPLIVKYKGMVRNCVEWQPTKGYTNKRRKWCRWSQSSTLPAPVSFHYHPDVRTKLSWLKPPCPMARLECIEKGGSSVSSLKGDVLSCVQSVFHHAVPLQPSAFLFSSWKQSSLFLPHVFIDVLRAWFLGSHWALSNLCQHYFTIQDSKVKQGSDSVYLTPRQAHLDTGHGAWQRARRQNRWSDNLAQSLRSW